MRNIACLGFFIALLFAFSACEEDDVCLDITTPRLNIEFRSATTGLRSSLDTIVLVQVNANAELEGFVFTERDSVLVQILPESITESRFRVARNTTAGAITDDFVLGFDRTEQFQSKACGFGFNYTNLSANLESNNLLQRIELQQTTIENEQNTVLTLFVLD